MIAALRAAIVALALTACGGPSVIWTGRTPDRRHSVEVIEDHDRQYVVVDGQRRAAYRAIAGWSIELSDDGHIAYAARIGDRWVVVHDGRAGETWNAIGELLLAPGNRLTYIAERAGKWHVVTAGVVGPAHGAILADSLTASPDGRRIAYAAIDDGHRVYVDGKPGPTFAGVGHLAFTADSAHVVYSARQGRAAHLVVDETPGPAWHSVDHLTLSPTGHRVAYAALDGDGWRLIVDGRPGPAVEAIRHIVFSANGVHVAWLGTVDDRGVLAVDDQPVAAPITRDGFWFGPVTTGEPTTHDAVPAAAYRLAYVAPIATGGEHVVVDGIAGAAYDEVADPVWSASGRVAYSARRGQRWCLVLDGKDTSCASWVGQPTFSPDGRRLAFLAQRGRAWFAIVDGQAFPFDLVMDGSLAFSADSKHWAVVAGELATETLFFAVDGTERVPLTSRELYSAATRHSNLLEPDPEAGDLLRRWSAAEAARASHR